MSDKSPVHSLTQDLYREVAMAPPIRLREILGLR